MLVLALAVSALSAAESVPSLDRLYSLPRITGTAPIGPAFSADGAKLAFLWNESGYEFRDVYVVSAGGASPTRLTNLSPTSPPREGDAGVVDVTWHPDGTIVFQMGAELFRVSSEGGSPERVAEGSQAQFSPDGRRLAYLQRGDLLLTERTLVSDPRTEVSVESFEWSPDGSSLAFIEEDETRVPVRGIPD